MYDFKSLLQKEPVAIAAAIIATLNLAQAFGFISVTADQLAQLNTTLVLILGLVVRQASVPTVVVEEDKAEAQAVAAAQAAEAFAIGLAMPAPSPDEAP